jgi:hypothetical protein
VFETSSWAAEENEVEPGNQDYHYWLVGRHRYSATRGLCITPTVGGVEWNCLGDRGLSLER